MKINNCEDCGKLIFNDCFHTDTYCDECLNQSDKGGET